MDLIVLRQATPAAVNDINHLLGQLTQGAAPTLSLQQLARKLSREGFVVVIAKEKDAIVGMASLQFMDVLSGRKAIVEDVIVDESFLRQGIAKRLMEKLISIALKWHASKIDLTSSDPRTAARGLYKSLGFDQRDTNVYRLYLPRPV